MKVWIVVVALLTGSCAHLPPSVSPAATLAANEIRLVQGLDLFRNAALDANARTPPVLSFAVTRQIVLYHESVLLLLQAQPAGWAATIKTGLGVIMSHLSAAEQEVLAPYLALVRTLIEVLA